MENEFHITYEAKPSSEDVFVLHQGITDYARQNKGMDPREPFGFFVRDKQGKIVAGCSGAIIHNCLHTENVWVSESLRRKGIGTNLLRAAKQLALENSCVMATINTMDDGMLELCLKLGYKVDLARGGYKNNATLYFLSKTL